MLGILGLRNLAELEVIFDKLIDLKIDITSEEIKAYSKDLLSNKAKLKNHTEEVDLADIVGIYSKSLLKETL